MLKPTSLASTYIHAFVRFYRSFVLDALHRSPNIFGSALRRRDPHVRSNLACVAFWPDYLTSLASYEFDSQALITKCKGQPGVKDVLMKYGSARMKVGIKLDVSPHR